MFKYILTLLCASAVLIRAVVPPVITKAPESLTRYRGEDAAFTVAVTGAAPFTYQWLRDGTALPGAADATLTLTNLTLADQANYSVVVADAAEVRVTSSAARLDIINPVVSATLTLTPAADTSIFSLGQNPQGSTILVGTRGSGVRDRGLIRFDFSSLPLGAIIKSAQLDLAVVRSSIRPSASTFSLYRMLTLWKPDATWASASGGIPWGQPGAQAGVDFSARSSHTGFGSGVRETFGPSDEMLRDVIAWVANPATNYGWLIKADSEDALRSAIHFGSMEIGTPPKLVIEYSVPPLPRLATVSAKAGTFAFEVKAAAGWIYRVESTDNAETEPWTTVTNTPVAASDTIPIKLPIEGHHRFYRVVVE